MRDFPSCFGENGVQVADSSSSNSSKNAQNVVTCVYQCRLKGKYCFITVTWSKNLMGQCLTVGIDDPSNQCLCKVDIKPWLFSRRKGSKTMEAYSSKIDIHWDFSSAKFGSGPEPLEGYYVGVVADRKMVLLIGDFRKEALEKTETNPGSSPDSILVTKKEHVFGKRVFATRAQFCSNGSSHDLSIECETVTANEPWLVIRVDGKNLVQVKRLRWKFRGNHTIVVDGIAIEVFWDVHSWLFGAASAASSAVFMFKTCLSAEKLPNSLFSQRFSDGKGLGLGFSLVLYAWKNE